MSVYQSAPFAAIPDFIHHNDWLDEELDFLTDALFEDKAAGFPSKPLPTVSSGSKSIITSRLMSREGAIVSPSPSHHSDLESVAMSESADESVKTESSSEPRPPVPVRSMSPRLEASLMSSRSSGQPSVVPPSPCVSSAHVMVLPASPRRMAHQSKHRDIFLKAVAIAASEQKSAPKRSSEPTEDPKSRQRERNRIMAKQTRERKKTAMASLKIVFAQLQGENKMLKELVAEHTTEAESKAILENCTAVERIPDMVWEACSPGGDNQQDQDDEDSTSGGDNNNKRKSIGFSGNDSDDYSHAGVSISSKEGQGSSKRQRVVGEANEVMAAHLGQHVVSAAHPGQLVAMPSPEPQPSVCVSGAAQVQQQHQQQATQEDDDVDDNEIIQDLVMSMEEDDQEEGDAIYQEIQAALAEEALADAATPMVAVSGASCQETPTAENNLAAEAKPDAVLNPSQMVFFSIPNPVAVLG